MADDNPGDAGFLLRWSRRKAQVRQGVELPEPAPALQAAVPALAQPAPVPTLEAPPTSPPPPLPTLADVAALTRDSDYSRFMAPGVDSGVKNAALKTLFTDPHFNVMDGLDTYIDDYGIASPLPESMLRQMAQAQFLGLFNDEAPDQATPTAPISHTAAIPPAQATPDEDAALRLQPNHAAGPAGPGPGAGPDTAGQC